MDRASHQMRRRLASWLVLIVGLLTLATWWGARDASALQADQIGDVELGEQLYAQQCAQCHASDGSGAIVPETNRRAPALADRPDVTAAYVDLVMRTGRLPPAADPFDNQPRDIAFDDQQRAAVVAYTVEQFDLAVDIPEVPEGDAGRGQSVYATQCAACHGATGAGGVAGGGAWTPSIARYDAVTLAEAMRVGPFQMPAFDESQITDQQMGDVAAFLEEVRHERGTPLGMVELNPVYASGFVALLAVVMILSLFWISSKPMWFPDPEGTAGEPDHKVDPDDAPDVTDSRTRPTDGGGAS
ncbi:MAG TPA: c-type cytochrome [Euzebyales bacterium]|nr:c-type cytochrome [Euzebyales bacterium]